MGRASLNQRSTPSMATFHYQNLGPGTWDLVLVSVMLSEVSGRKSGNTTNNLLDALLAYFT